MYNADPGNFWLWVIVLCVVSVVGLVAGFVFLLRAWTVEETPVSLIRSAAQGYVKLEGHADLMTGPPIISPLTQSRCTWWSYKVEQRRNTGRGQAWQTTEHGTSNDLFLIRDTTSQCVIDPTDAEVIPTTKTVWYGDQPEPVRGPQVGGFALTSPYRYIEERIAPQDPIFALGFFRTESGNLGAMAINQEVAEVLHEWKQDYAGLLRRFDADHDGQLSDREWETARAAAREQVLAQERQDAQRPPMNVLAKPQDGRRFIISTRSEKQVTRRFQLWAAACLLLFVVAGAAVGYLIATHHPDFTTAAQHR